MSSGSEEPWIGGIHGEWHPCRHLAMSQIDIDGSVISHLSQSHLACQSVAQRMELRHRRSGLWALLTLAVAILHTSFHQASRLFL